ncbi:hypothetical protein D3C72_1237220 [compost metagenome]
MTWLRLLMSTMSTPSAACTHTHGPMGVRTPDRPPCECASTTFITVTCRSIGSPEAGPHLPPRRSSKLAPTPASRHSCTAPRSHTPPKATSPMPRSTTARSMKVLSLVAPPPGLSAVSAMTTGPSGVAMARASVSSIESEGTPVSWRRSQKARPSSSASLAASAGSLSVTTHSLAPDSGTSAQGKPWPSDTESTPGSFSASCMRRTKPAIGSRVVCHLPTMRQSCTAVTGFTRPCAVSTTMRISSVRRSNASVCGYSL